MYKAVIDQIDINYVQSIRLVFVTIEYGEAKMKIKKSLSIKI